MPQKIEKQLIDDDIEEKSEISETDSSVVSTANVELGTITSIKCFPKNKKFDLMTENINSDQFFDIPVKTKIKYADKDMKNNKFNNLF